MDDFLNIRKYTEFSKEGMDWTEAFERAVSDLEKAGGGTLFVPAGVFPTRSVELKSNMTLYLDNCSERFFTDDIENYTLVEGNFEGLTVPMYKPCIYASHASNVMIKGEGRLNGNGKKWWERFRAHELEGARPYLVHFEYCDNVKIENITLTMSPAWTVHPLFSTNVVVHGVTIKNPADSPNTDGINPDSCKNVRISDCIIDVGDDCIAIKSGVEESRELKPCENITITNCNMVHGHGGVVIGSEASGSVRNVTVSNCVFQDTDRGIRLKTRRRRGGRMEKLTFSNILMDRVMCPFVFNMFYFCGKYGKEPWVSDQNVAPVNESTPLIRDININNITVVDAAACAGFMAGLPEQYIENITFANCNISMAEDGEPDTPAMMAGLRPMKAAGFVISNAKGIVFDNVKLQKVQGKTFKVDQMSEVTFE